MNDNHIADEAQQVCEYCDCNYPLHDLDCPVAIAARAKSEYEAEYAAPIAPRADADTAGAKPEYMTVSQAPTSQYAQGWNDCLAAGASNGRADVEKDAALTELLNDRIELNMSNYNEDDVSSLNEWAIRAYAILAAKDSAPSEARGKEKKS